MRKPAVQSIVVLSLGLAAALVSYALPVGPRATGSELPGSLAATTKPSDSLPAERLPPSRPVPAEYRIVFKRSMFAKHVATEKMQGDAAAGPARSNLQDYALRGVASQEGSFVAFVEDSPKSIILRLRRGDAVARGRVSKISFGGIDYEDGGQTTHVEIGCRLDGSRPDASGEGAENGERKASKKLKPADAPAAGEKQVGEKQAGEKPAPERKEKER